MQGKQSCYLTNAQNLRPIQAFEKVGFRIIRQGKRITRSDGSRRLYVSAKIRSTHNAIAMGGIVRDAGSTVREFRQLLRSFPFRSA